MTSDDALNQVPDNAAEVRESEAHVIPEIPEDAGFPGRWAEGEDDSAEVVQGFGGRWSGQPDDSAETSQEFGGRWSGAPDDSGTRAEDFGAMWAGDNQDPHAP